MLPEEETLTILLQGGNTQFPQLFNTSLHCLIVVSYSQLQLLAQLCFNLAQASILLSLVLLRCIEVIIYVRKPQEAFVGLRNWRIGGQWRKNELLPKNPKNRHTARRDTVNVWPRARTYSQSVTDKPYFHQLFHSSCFLVISYALVEIELMIGFFSVFEVVELQGNYIEELYGPGEYKLTWMLVVAFSTLHVYFIYQT